MSAAVPPPAAAAESPTALLQELDRGTVVLACLLALRTPGYGYALLQTLAGAGLPVEANTLYPLLRRLEKQGLLDSTWDTSASRPRKYYATNAVGRQTTTVLLDHWQHLDRALAELADPAPRPLDPPTSLARS